MTTHAQSTPPTGDASLIEQALLKALAQSTASLEPPNPENPAAAIPAIAYCVQRYTSALQSAIAKGRSRYESEKAAKAAYNQALPPLHGQENIRAFIACVTHGMAIQAIDGADGTRLLYAANIGYLARKSPLKAKKPTT